MVSNIAKVEALIYASGDQGISLNELSVRSSLSQAACRQLVAKIQEILKDDEKSGLEILISDGVCRMATKKEFSKLVEDFVNDVKPRVLSQAALETVSIIMYNQPITRIEVDKIRGVNSSAIIHRLVNQGLVKVTGIRQEIGNPREYGSTNYCLDYFGLSSIKDLPALPKDEKLDENTSDSLIARFNTELDKDKQNE